MPITTVQKMIGAMIILISLIKPSPSGFIDAPTAEHPPLFIALLILSLFLAESPGYRAYEKANALFVQQKFAESIHEGVRRYFAKNPPLARAVARI